MLGIAAVPGALLALAVLIAVESPRWFAKVGRRERRPLFIAGLTSMALSLATVGFAFWRSGAQGSVEGSAGVTALVVFIISFAFSLSPVTWTVINEIYDRTGLHVLAVHRILLDRPRPGHCRRARDTRPLAGRDRGVVDARPAGPLQINLVNRRGSPQTSPARAGALPRARPRTPQNLENRQPPRCGA
jgi:hypothetical protein